jgi:hypothetical protein
LQLCDELFEYRCGEFSVFERSVNVSLCLLKAEVLS